MKLLLTAVWLGLAVASFVHAADQFAEADRPLPAFEVDPPKFKLQTEGFRFEIDLQGTPLDQPIRDFEDEWNGYVAESGASLARAHRRAAWTGVAGGVASLAALLLLWTRPAAPAPRDD